MTRAPRSGFPGADPADRRILVVDDEAAIREAIARFLTARGFDVSTVDSGTAALQQLERNRFAALLCDVRMPGASGMDILPEILRVDPDLAVLMLTGLNDATTATEAMAHGAADYLLKPIELDRLEQAVEQALRRRHERIDQRDVAELVTEEVALRTDELEREKLALRGLAVTVLESIVTLSEAKDPFRAGHAQRAAELSGAVARALGLDADTVAHIQVAARLHDVGNVAISEALLHRPASLTPDEYAQVQRHVQAGVQILTPIRHLAAVVQCVRDHHERWDGTGYPSRTIGDAISVGGRILAVTDAFVAVTAGRPYFTALPPVAALAHLAPRAGSHFDPSVFRAVHDVVRTRLG